MEIYPVDVFIQPSNNHGLIYCWSMLEKHKMLFCHSIGHKEKTFLAMKNYKNNQRSRKNLI